MGPKSLKNKVIFLVFVLFALIFVLTLVSVYTSARQLVEEQIQGRLHVGKGIFNNKLALLKRKLESNAATIADDWALRKAIGQGVDKKSLLSIIINHSQRVSADAAILLDPDGKILASTINLNDSSLEQLNSLLSSDATPTKAKLCLLDMQWFFIAAAPVEAPIQVGWLLIARRLDTSFLAAISTLTGLEIGVISSGEHTTDLSTQPQASIIGNQLNLDELTSNDSNAPDVRIVSTQSQEYIVLPHPVKNIAGINLVVLLYDSLSKAMAPFMRFWLSLIPVFVIGVIVALVGAFSIAKGVTKPIEKLLEAVRLISRGRYANTIDLSYSGEIGNLAKEFDTMQHAVMAREQKIIQQAKALEETNEIRLQGELAKKEKQVAEAATKAKNQFLANMSHEIRTPLSAIVGFSEILQDPTIDQDERDNAAKTIHRSSHHLLNITNDILDVSKIEAGKIVLEMMPASLFEILAELEMFSKITAKAKKLKFELCYEFPLPETFKTDPTRLKQILFNLSDNAIKFTKHGKVTIKVSLDTTLNWLIFSIIDSGIGMTPSQLEKLFTTFEQADSATTRKFGGTGLGLFISKELAEMLGGSIEVESKPGEGSQFHVRLPIEAEANTNIIKNEDQLKNLQARTGGLVPIPSLWGRVLYAEDNIDSQRLIAYLLRNTGVEFDVVSNGLEAVERGRNHQYDVILMDMQMPEMDGLEACRSLRDAGFTNPIIMLTANIDHASIASYEQAGATGYLGKPINTGKLYTLLIDLLPGDEQTNTYSPEMQADHDALTDQFLSGVPALIKNMREALTATEWKTLGSLAHQLKGSGGSYGFQALSEVSENIETSIKNQQYDELNNMVDQLSENISQIMKSRNPTEA